MVKRGRMRPVREYMSPDLCREILCRLPVKDLVRFRLVCKTWRSIINDPQFVSLHLTRYNNNVEESHLFVLERWRNISHYPVFRRSDTFRKTAMSDCSPLKPGGFIFVVGHINGLFVLYIYEDKITVWNPSIRRHFALPPFPSSLSQHDFSLGFGFDPSTNDYKVVSVCQQAGFNDSVPTTVYLYTFKSGRWRVISSDHRFPRFPISSTFIKGIIYWARRDVLLLFDVGKETFSSCNVPDYVPIVEKPLENFPVMIRESLAHLIMDKPIPVIFRESLALLTQEYERNHYCLWVRDQYANWIKIHTVKFKGDPYSFMCVKKNGEMLFKAKKMVCLYNVNTREMKVLARSYHGHDEPAFECMESLVWPIGV